MDYMKEENLRMEIHKTKLVAEEIINKGVIGSGYLNLKNTLELHQTIKILLEELDDTLSKDISIEYCVNKAVSVRKEMKSAYKMLLSRSKHISREKEYG